MGVASSEPVVVMGMNSSDELSVSARMMFRVVSSSGAVVGKGSDVVVSANVVDVEMKAEGLASSVDVDSVVEVVSSSVDVASVVEVVSEGPIHM